MQPIKPEDMGFWLFTQGSSIHLTQGKLPFGKAVDLGLNGLNALKIGEWQQQPFYLIENQTEDTRD